MFFTLGSHKERTRQAESVLFKVQWQVLWRQVAVKAGLDDDVGFDWIHLIKRQGSLESLQCQAATEAARSAFLAKRYTFLLFDGNRPVFIQENQPIYSNISFLTQ